jgi:drug/metabolite transporter (DMT)-like permease
MGAPGLAVAICFAAASIGFVMAIQYTTVANVILILAAVPLVAALIGRVVFATPINRETWIAIAAVLAGVAIIVIGPGGGGGSAIGNALAGLVTLAFASATVVTRQYHGIRMTPAVCTAMVLAAAVAGANASGFIAGPRDFALLFAFGALNLGLGMALFVTGARLIPAALTALLGTLETVLQPIWVWLFHGETPATRTLVGGAVVVTALVVHILFEARRSQGPAPSVPTPP